MVQYCLNGVPGFTTVSIGSLRLVLSLHNRVRGDVKNVIGSFSSETVWNDVPEIARFL